jgi:hypothetical protein
MCEVVAKKGESHGMPAIAEIVLPPLSVIFLKHEGDG